MNRKPPDLKGAKRSGFGANRKPPDPKAAAQRAALSALKRAQRHADRAGVTLSEWEGEFLGSVADRLKTFGRAFGDPEKGAPGQALSALQTVKLKEITAKAKGEKKELKRKPFKRRGTPA
ncbi:hypothetical protein [Phenylobacterium sp.]|uniref:hypothetical protein n=1 Tax=Phenylobacterium sp. TaxID=1871053 RepID=UPI00374D8895